MEAEGTEFRVNAPVGDGIDIEVLLASYAALVLACGATSARDLPVPGRELAGIHQEMEYLPPANKVQQGDLPVSPVDVPGKHGGIIGRRATRAPRLGPSRCPGRGPAPPLGT